MEQLELLAGYKMPDWVMHCMPKAGKALCRLYMDNGRVDEAITVALTCYVVVRFK